MAVVLLETEATRDSAAAAGLLRRGRKGSLLAGCLLLGGLILFALLAPVFGSPYHAYPLGLTKAGLPLAVGSRGHLLGTDEIGRDMLARLAAGGRVTLEMTFFANLTSMGLGILVGLVAGFFRGLTEQVLMRITDVFLSVPTIVSGLALASVVGEGIAGIVVVVTALYWAWTARVIYGEVLRLSGRVFVDAAVAAGVPRLTIVRRHILPHLSSLILVLTALNAAAVVSIGAGLSYLGAGIQLPRPDWGNMLQSGENAIGYAPHLVVVPLVAIVLTVLSFMLIAEGLTSRAVGPEASWLDT